MDACLFVNSMLFSKVHEDDGLVKGPNLLFLQSLHHDSIVRVIFDFQICASRDEEVIDVFVVDLEVGDPDFVVMGRVVLSESEDVSNSAGKDSGGLRRPKHGVGLTAGCLAVHEDCSIVAMHCCFGNGSGYDMVDLRGGDLRSIYIV